MSDVTEINEGKVMIFFKLSAAHYQTYVTAPGDTQELIWLAQTIFKQFLFWFFSRFIFRSEFK